MSAAGGVSVNEGINGVCFGWGTAGGGESSRGSRDRESLRPVKDQQLDESTVSVFFFLRKMDSYTRPTYYKLSNGWISNIYGDIYDGDR